MWLVSPLKRTHQTALATGGQPNALITEPDLIEQNFGDWQGMSHDRIAKERPEESRRFWLAPAELAPPGGESFADLCARVGPMLERWSVEHRKGDIIAVCHGGTIRAAAAHALGLSPATALKIKVDTLSLSTIERYRDGAWAVGSLNVSG
jgi:alpha-ribazole phosphatase